MRWCAVSSHPPSTPTGCGKSVFYQLSGLAWSAPEAPVPRPAAGAGEQGGDVENYLPMFDIGNSRVHSTLSTHSPQPTRFISDRKCAFRGRPRPRLITRCIQKRWRWHWWHRTGSGELIYRFQTLRASERVRGAYVVVQTVMRSWLRRVLRVLGTVALCVRTVFTAAAAAVAGSSKRPATSSSQDPIRWLFKKPDHVSAGHHSGCRNLCWPHTQSGTCTRMHFIFTPVSPRLL